MKSTAVVCVEKGVVKLQEIDVPDPKEHEIQVRVHTSVISQGTERAFILNLENTNGVYPHFPGYCAAGVVERTGSGVTRFQVGDRVACIGVSHRSLGNIDEQRAVRVPAAVSFEEAAFLTMGVIAMQGVRKLRIELGESAMILGLGLIGQLALQFAAMNGAQPAIGVDRAESRLLMAKASGASSVINSSEEQWQDMLKASTQGVGPHVVIESTGFPEAIETAFDAVRKYGRVVLLGSTRGESSINFYQYVHKKAITIIGAHAPANPKFESHPGYWTWHDNADCYMRLMESKRIQLDPLITHRVTWNQAEQIYEQILSWNSHVMGVVMNWQ
ncbi:MAG: gatD 2 [Paenibacillus sp.]|nr:gatD 2 [Paenibacillus sp.]